MSENENNNDISNVEFEPILEKPSLETNTIPIETTIITSDKQDKNTTYPRLIEQDEVTQWPKEQMRFQVGKVDELVEEQDIKKIKKNIIINLFNKGKRLNSNIRNLHLQNVDLQIAKKLISKKFACGCSEVTMQNGESALEVQGQFDDMITFLIENVKEISHLLPENFEIAEEKVAKQEKRKK